MTAQPSCLSGLSLPVNRCVDYGYRLDDPNSGAPLEIAGASDHGFGVSHCARFVGVGMQLNYVAIQAQRPSPADSIAELRIWFNDNLGFGDLRPATLVDAVPVTLPGAITSTDFQVVELDTTYDTTPAASFWIELYFPTASSPCMGTRVQVTPGTFGEGIVAVHEATAGAESWDDYQSIPVTAYLNRVPVLRPLHLVNCAPCYVNVVPTGLNVTTEDGDSVEIECSITSPPTDSVFIDIITTAPGEGLANVSQLVFTAATAPIPQYFWVVGQDDAVLDGDSLYHVRGTATSNDQCYDGEIGQSSLTNLDNEHAFMELVPVGDAGNPDDLFGFGGVAYDYEIGKYEVTNDQYIEFLNAIGASDNIGLYDPLMGTDIRGGISRTGSFGSYSYAARTTMGDKPVNFVSLLDCMRFVNWLQNSMPSGSIDPTTTENGSYDMGAIGTIINRRATGSWYVPTIDELYKAAFYDPVSVGADSGITPDYWMMPNSSNINPPNPAFATVLGDVANPGYAVMNFNNSAVWNGATGNVTTVGTTGPQTASHYGAFDLGGNVAEWDDEQVLNSGMVYSGTNGASWAPGLEPSVGQFPMFSHLVDSEDETLGFRVVKLSPICKCGDANGDGVISIGDAVWIINYIFGGGPLPCNGDADGSGTVSIGDAVAIINYIFGGGPAPTCP